MKLILKALASLFIVAAAGLAWFYFLVLDRDLDKGAPLPVDTAVAADAYKTAIDGSRALVAALRRDAQYPSLSVAVIFDGAMVWREAMGYADLKSARKAGADAQYPIGSISKPLTATAAMILVENGVLSLDAGVETYLPDIPAAYRGVTMRQLLSHQAGVRHYKWMFNPPFFSENGLNTEYASVADGLSIFIDDPLLFAPDSSFSYSTFGYSLASRVMEEAAGEDFLALVDRLLIDPLALDATEADRASPPPPRRTTDYIGAVRRWGVFETPPTNSSYKWAGGGFVSTPQEIARFGAAFLSGALVDADAFAEMTTPRAMANGEINPQSYGLGWRSGTMSYPKGSETTTPIIHHGGTALGAECILLLAPEQRVVASICGNAYTGGSGKLLQLAADVGRLFIDEKIAAAQ